MKYERLKGWALAEFTSLEMELEEEIRSSTTDSAAESYRRAGRISRSKHNPISLDQIELRERGRTPRQSAEIINFPSVKTHKRASGF